MGKKSIHREKNIEPMRRSRMAALQERYAYMSAHELDDMISVDKFVVVSSHELSSIRVRSYDYLK